MKRVETAVVVISLAVVAAGITVFVMPVKQARTPVDPCASLARQVLELSARQEQQQGGALIAVEALKHLSPAGQPLECQGKFRSRGRVAAGPYRISATAGGGVHWQPVQASHGPKDRSPQDHG